ncbi:hypothetical protein Tco_1057033 [Tanacetum coccineum]|uniref:Uncharacterized protein n=1 Tax=Tanacetum coccineum TaxID=301880 RepID=A0ABQ5H589_9ASTR
MDSSFTLGSTEEADNIKILQSCNGLLLCTGSGRLVFDSVYNPSTNQFKRILHPDCSLDNSPYYKSAGLRMAFDLTKSPHYKLVDAGRRTYDIVIQIYSSEIETKNRQLTHYRLNIEDHEHPVITTIQIPQRGMNFLKSYGYMDPMLILIQIPHLCHVDTDDFMTPLPEGWSIRSTVWSIVLEEKEDESFLVINLSEKVVQYNLISKTIHEIYDCGSNQLDDNHDDDDELLQLTTLGFSAIAMPKAQFVTEGGLFVGTRRVVEVDHIQGVVGARCFDLDLSFSGLVIAAFLELDLGLPL